MFFIICVIIIYFNVSFLKKFDFELKIKLRIILILRNGVSGLYIDIIYLIKINNKNIYLNEYEMLCRFVD